MLSIPSLLMVFLMLALSSFAVFWARRLKVPHTVFLVAIGAVLGLLTFLPEFAFINAFRLTPELLFYVLLPTLIFESAYNMNLRKLTKDGAVVTVLAVASMLVSAVAIGLALHFVLGLMGIELPLVIALLFGALISATDPVAVLALFKEYGAPRRLSMVFEGESLFNDATAVALFLVLLEVALHGFEGATTVFAGVLIFTVMIVGGLAFGLVVGLFFAKLVEWTRASEAASITLTVVLAHVTFLASELISHHLVIGGQSFHLSSIIATTTASLIMGNYGRSKIHPRAEEFVEKLWGQFAFMVNSVIFILIGLLFVSIPLTESSLYLPIIATVLVVAAARALSIYPVIGIFNLFADATRRIPRSWQHLLSWGSLRGALAVIMVMLIPSDLAIEGWSLAVSPHDFILSLTVGCIFATLFIKATTIQGMMKRLQLDVPTAIESLEYEEARALIHRKVTERLAYYVERGYITPALFAELNADHTREYKDATASVRSIGSQSADELTKRVIRIFAIGIEKRHLKVLYHYDEVSEQVYKRILHKLSLQLEAVEKGDIESDTHIHTKGGDLIDRLMRGVRDILTPLSPEEQIAESYMYYRAQAIIARKVLKELGELSTSDAESIFTKEALEYTTATYTRFRTQSQQKMESLEAAHPAEIDAVKRSLAVQGVSKVEERVLEDVYQRELVTPKLYIGLKEELDIH